MRGTGAAYGGRAPRMLSKRYQDIYAPRVEIGAFPHDVPPLSEASVSHLVDLSKTHAITPDLQAWLAHTQQPDNIVNSLTPLIGNRYFEAELRYLLSERWTGRTELIDAAMQRSRRATIPSRWTYDRARAHLQEENPLLRRIARSDRMWAYWKAAKEAGTPPPTQDVFQRMAEIERLESHLETPLWMALNATAMKRDADAEYEENLQQRGISRAAIVNEMMGWRDELS